MRPFPAPAAPSQRRWRLRAVAAVVLALAAAGCGDALEAPLGVSETLGPADALSAETTSTAAATDPEDVGEVPETSAPPGVTDTSEPPASDAAPAGELQGLRLEMVASGFHQPTAVAAPFGDDRLFVVERQGVVRMLDAEGNVAEDPFLDLRDRVGSNGIEQGLLGLGFHPDYAANGRVFVYYTDTSGNRQLSEFGLSTDPDRVDAGTEEVLFELPQPAGSTDIRHYGGNVDFGPDGYLYVSLGDGADGRNQGQDPGTMYGTIVRLDVDGGEPYAIPADNPFVAGGGAAEVWAYGLRNPWRFAIDAADGLIYVADVGQEKWEEVNVVPIDTGGGSNFGWSTTEGMHCYSPSDCDMTGLTLPVLEYDHDQGCSITGGFVYRGSAIPEIDGHYFYGDWCGLWVRSFRYADGAAMDERDWSDELVEAGQVNSFGVDGFGELYIANFEGVVYKIVAVR